MAKLRVECHYAECHYAECHYAECHYAECNYAECNYAECNDAECHNTECLGAVSAMPPLLVSSNLFLFSIVHPSIEGWRNVFAPNDIVPARHSSYKFLKSMYYCVKLILILRIEYLGSKKIVLNIQDDSP